MTLKEKLVQETLLLLPNVKLIYLFGSQVNGHANKNSDIDIAILLDKKLAPVKRFDLQESLAIKLNKDIDLVDLLSASTVMQNQVIQQGELIYGNKATCCQFEMQILSMYQHLNDERADILQDYTK
ncbi:nucleotidyltransferase domain-containing protein [Marinomonas sp. C2222]|uniref:Nucleotidyltransferase domain-containing protein n=1 Tax=Marinomonas sargassi TaxID=2984494 RepID=A0ABT2YR26_9GAMM|nr:nucleotidyltransferase domain-containing protein [Marinomonas sargassi]MCV2402104.1 nucleotidyltransferase domain-containing protein [Marinomonas sargassi]